MSTPWGRRGRERRGDAPGGPVLVHPNAPAPAGGGSTPSASSSSPSRWSARKRLAYRASVHPVRKYRARDNSASGVMYTGRPLAPSSVAIAPARARYAECRPQSLFAAKPRLGVFVFRYLGRGENGNRLRAPANEPRRRGTRDASPFSFLQSHENAATADRVATRGFTFSRERAPALSPPTLSCFTVLRAALRTARSP